MAISQDATDYGKRRDHQPRRDVGDVNAQTLQENVLSRIEDATYEILRKYEKKSA